MTTVWTEQMQMCLLFVRPQISPSNILLFHLAIIETLLCVVYLVLAVPLLTRDDESIAAHTICSLNAFLTTLLQPIALWTVCGLNCDRYYAISAPLHYNAIVNSKKVIHCLCVVEGEGRRALFAGNIPSSM